MQTLGTGAPRLLRALLLTGLVLALAALAHALGGGHLPSAPVLALLGVLLLPLAVLACARQVRPLPAVLLLGAGQLALHQTFGMLTACGTGTLGTAATATGSAHLLHSGTVLAGTAGSTCHTGAAVVDGTAMLVLHALATVAVALLVAATDRVLWLLARGIAPVLAAALRRLRAALRLGGAPDPRAARTRGLPVPDAPPAPPRTAVTRSDAPRRGPPAPRPSSVPAALRAPAALPALRAPRALPAPAGQGTALATA
ncbi:MAG TPA: hypothetical protein VGC67_05000 [Cellulomonas sp.]